MLNIKGGSAGNNLRVMKWRPTGEHYSDWGIFYKAVVVKSYSFMYSHSSVFYTLQIIHPSVWPYFIWCPCHLTRTWILLKSSFRHHRQASVRLSTAWSSDIDALVDLVGGTLGAPLPGQDMPTDSIECAASPPFTLLWLPTLWILPCIDVLSNGCIVSQSSALVDVHATHV